MKREKWILLGMVLMIALGLSMACTPTPTPTPTPNNTSSDTITVNVNSSGGSASSDVDTTVNNSNSNANNNANTNNNTNNNLNNQSQAQDQSQNQGQTQNTTVILDNQNNNQNNQSNTLDIIFQPIINVINYLNITNTANPVFYNNPVITIESSNGQLLDIALDQNTVQYGYNEQGQYQIIPQNVPYPSVLCTGAMTPYGKVLGVQAHDTNATSVPMQSTGFPIGTLLMGMGFAGIGIVGAAKSGLLARLGY